MVKKIEISEEENSLLKDYLRQSPLQSIRSRCQAILMHEKGMELADIGDIVSRHEDTIRKWIKDWQTIRIAGIFTGHEENENASKLTKEQREQIKKTLQQGPCEQGLEKAFWDVPTLKNYIAATFGVVYESERSYHFLLKFSRLSFKYPDTFDCRRDEAKIAERMNAIRKEIKPLLEAEDWEVFASDEVRIELEALTRRAWLKRGERTIIEVNRKREAQSYIGLLNQKTFVCHTYEMPWQNQAEVLKSLQLFLTEYPGKKICIVWDNAAFHKGKIIQKALEKGGLLEHVHLVALPPYAPDKNPIEHVWNDAKRSIANIQRENFVQTKDAFIQHIKNRKFAYQI